MSATPSHIDWYIVSEYLMAGCSGREIAAMIGVCEDTLYNRCRTDLNQEFSAFKQEKQAADATLAALQQRISSELANLGAQA